MPLTDSNANESDHGVANMRIAESTANAAAPKKLTRALMSKLTSSARVAVSATSAVRVAGVVDGGGFAFGRAAVSPSTASTSFRSKAQLVAKSMVPAHADCVCAPTYVSDDSCASARKRM